MNLLSGIEQIKQLPVDRQRRFERFSRTQYRYRVLPLFADVYLIIAFIGTLLFLAGQLTHSVEPPVFAGYLLYTGVLTALILAHRFTRLRRAAPLVVYLVFINMATFSYLGYIGAGAAIAPVVGLFFFISSVGIITLSLKHTSIILAANLILLVLATAVTAPTDQVVTVLIGVITNWLILMCLVVSPLSAWFFSKFLRNLLALQFLLRDRNRQLSRALQTLEATEDKLAQEQKHQALSHMAKGLLHEITNPLNCAIQAVDFSAAINRNADVAEALDDAASHQHRIAEIVSDLIEFSRPAPDHGPEAVNLDKLVQTALRFCRHQLQGTAVTIQIPAGLSVACFPSPLIQVFVNLLMNASSAIRAASPARPQIRITAAATEAVTSITVRDNGKGIDSSDLQRLTDPFFSTSETPDNLGLGLSICHTIMRHHRGAMKIASEPGQWTEVILELPRHIDGPDKSTRPPN